METLETITGEDLIRLYQLYENKCKNNGWSPSVRDWVIWLAEEGYIDAD